MIRIPDANNLFDNLFNIDKDDISSLVIKENNTKANCYIQAENGTFYGGFIIIDKPTVQTICNVSFYKSTTNEKYLPRLTFKKITKNGEAKPSKGNDVIISFSDGKEATNFWKLIHFLQRFKEIVDMGEFHSKFQAVSFEKFLVEFQNKGEAERIKELTSLAEKTKLNNEEIKKLLFPERRNCIHWFYALIKNLSNKENTPVFQSYRDRHKITEPGEEAIWHHFLKMNEWIIGLNVDVKFIRDLLSEQKVGEEDSKGKGSPTVDFLGISYFTTLIELKTSKTLIFKTDKSSKSRANTWSFSNDFIEAYSQTLGQRTVLNDGKKIKNNEGNIIDNEINRILDPKSVLIIGCRNSEFPHERNPDFNIKSDCFERFRRDNRNIEIITFDELFERAFYIVFTEKLPEGWFKMDSNDFIKNVLKVNKGT